MLEPSRVYRRALMRLLRHAVRNRSRAGRKLRRLLTPGALLSARPRGHFLSQRRSRSRIGVEDGRPHMDRAHAWRMDGARRRRAFGRCRFDRARAFAPMAASLPVLFCGSGEGAQFVRELDIGWVTGPGDYQGVRKQIENLASMTERDYKLLRGRVKSLATSMFDFDDQLDRLINFIDSIA